MFCANLKTDVEQKHIHMESITWAQSCLSSQKLAERIYHQKRGRNLKKKVFPVQYNMFLGRSLQKYQPAPIFKGF